MSFDFSKEPGRVRLDRGLNTEGQPLVSIITPYFNAGRYFEQTYNSVMNQTFPWFEWIIVDDGSTEENDVHILKSLANKDTRIKLYCKENGGSASARNHAIKMSTTEYIIPLDADDLIDPTYIEVLFWTLYFNSDRSWAYTKSVGFQEQEYLWDKPFDTNQMKTYNTLTNSAVIRKADILEVGCFDELIKYYNEDWRLWLKLLSKGKKPVRAGYFGFWYRRLNKSALTALTSNLELKKLDKQIIDEVAANVDTSVTAKEYPFAIAPGRYLKPRCSQWDRKTFRDHKKLHILMLIPWMAIGGADLFNLEIAKNIDKNRFELSILTTVQSDNPLRQQFEEYVTDIFELPSFLDTDNYAEFVSYFIKSRQIDVIFLSNSYYGYYLVPWLRKEFPDIAIADYVHMEEWYWRNGGYARVSGVIEGLLDKTYVCNERTRQVMINMFGKGPENIDTIYIGVDTDKYDADKVMRGIARQKHKIDANRPMVLFPCRIHPQKRPFLMLEIAKELKKKVKDVAFTVVGDGPQLEELIIKAKAEKLEDTVYFAGKQDNMLPYYKDSDVTLICSLKEGLALTAYESLSMGTPVVSSDVGGQRELIDGKVGALLPLLQSEITDLDNRSYSKEEIMQYVNVINNILSDKNAYGKMAMECRNRIVSRFSYLIMLNKMQNEFESLSKSNNDRSGTYSNLRNFSRLADDFVTLYNEIENYENAYKYSYAQDTRNELVRLASSKWGSRIIKLAFRLRLNKLLR